MDKITAISRIIKNTPCLSEAVRESFRQRAKEGRPTRDEYPQSHFCVYFLPYNAAKQEVFIIHHKKSGLWLSPGGHLDKGETPMEALNREINEELGMKDFFKEEQKPFLLTITPINNNTQPCKAHYDIWYLVQTDGSKFNVDPAEFYDAKWLTLEGAKKIVTDQPNINALDILKKK